MTGKIVVDSNTVIAFREGISSVCSTIYEADTIFLPVVVLGELFYGALNSANPHKNEKMIWQFAKQSVVVPVDEKIAVRYAIIRLNLKKKGMPIPENDIWVAATSQELNAPLFARDIHFTYVDGLKVINWG